MPVDCMEVSGAVLRAADIICMRLRPVLRVTEEEDDGEDDEDEDEDEDEFSSEMFRSQ